MEAGGLLRVRPFSSLPLTPYFHRRLTPLPCSFAVKGFSSSSPAPPSASSQGMYRGPKPRRDLVEEWVSGNDSLVRSLPIFVGGVSLLAVLVNRAFSGIAPVADASSSQSRADILTLSLAVTDLLTGLVWLSIRPKLISPVVPHGVECERIKSGHGNLFQLQLVVNLWLSCIKVTAFSKLGLQLSLLMKMVRQ